MNDEKPSWVPRCMFGHVLCVCGHTRGQHSQDAACYAYVPDNTPRCKCKQYSPLEYWADDMVFGLTKADK